jgi:ArsR family transcriptional regulator
MPTAQKVDDGQIVRVLKALADAKRFRMVQELAKAGELSCGELAEKFELSQPTVSHHLKILIDAGVVEARTDAQHHFLSVNRELVAQLGTLLPSRLTAPLARKKSRP